jgi:hypothetical protein
MKKLLAKRGEVSKSISTKIRRNFGENSQKIQINFGAEDPHTVATLIKMCMRTAINPIIPNRLRPLFIISHSELSTLL